MVGYKKFQDGLHRVLVVGGEKEGIGLQLHAAAACTTTTKNVAGQRVLIVLDFSFALDDLMNQIGSVHSFGQVDVPEIHLLGNGCFPGDHVRMLQLVNKLKERGAAAIEACQDEQEEQPSREKMLDLGLGNGIYTVAGLYVILKALKDLAETNCEIRDWLKILGTGFKIFPNEEVTDIKQITVSSQAAACAFLSRCLRLPLGIQKLVLDELCQRLWWRMNDVEPCGMLRGM